MLLVIEIKPELQQEAEALVPERYEDLDTLVNVALRNQLALERERHGRGTREPQRSAPPSPASPGTGGTDDWRALLKRVAEDAVQPMGQTPTNDSARAILWGQVNRVLPIAAGLRVLAHSVQEEGSESIRLAAWHSRAAEVAIQLAEYVEVLDTNAGRVRGELWATGLPTADRSSVRRYTTQFLGGREGDSMPGAAELLGLIVAGGQGNARQVGLTAAGVQFSTLTNPVFDERRPLRSFDVMETRWYLEHIERHLPRELELMRDAADLIHRGVTRTELDHGLAERWPALASVATTMRAGVVGRLHDLGLLQRTRAGTSVSYALTDLAYDLRLEEP